MDPVEIATAVFDHAAVFVFAATGALAAAQRRHDIVTFGFFAAVTGVGGGTLRDLLMGAPVFWVDQPAYLVSCLAAGLAVWVFGPGRFRQRLLIWLDALGLSAYAVMGAAKALAFGLPPLTAVVMGVMTATVGGIVRDVLAHQPSVLLRREIYVTAALLGAALMVALDWVGAPFWAAAACGFAGALALRSAAIVFSLSLPGFRRGVAEDSEG